MLFCKVATIVVDGRGAKCNMWTGGVRVGVGNGAGSIAGVRGGRRGMVTTLSIWALVLLTGTALRNGGLLLGGSAVG